jgi:dihydrodipicolinate synthase/N-acetylneuraminate lyase
MVQLDDSTPMSELLTRHNLRGTWAPTLLPLDASERIDFGLLDNQLTALIASGVDGIYTNGTSGEFHAMDDDEFDQLSLLTQQRCVAAGRRFQLGASHMSGQLSLGRIRRAAELRPGAIQVVLPDWLPLSAAEVLRSIEGFAAAAGEIPLVLYNPPHAKTRLTLADLGELGRRFDTLIGVKVAGGDAQWYREMRDSAGDLAVFIPGHQLATGISNGAHGAYSNVACLNPQGAVDWYRMMTTDPVAAGLVEKQIADLLQRHVIPLQAQGYCNAALDKALAHAGGWTTLPTRMRWPYLGVPPAAAAALGVAARATVPQLFDDHG